MTVYLFYFTLSIIIIFIHTDDKCIEGGKKKPFGVSHSGCENFLGGATILVDDSGKQFDVGLILILLRWSMAYCKHINFWLQKKHLRPKLLYLQEYFRS